MSKFEWILPEDCDLQPCPNACGGMTEDPYGGPCQKCWDAVCGKEANDEW